MSGMLTMRVGRGMLIRACIVAASIGIYLWLTRGLIPPVPHGCFSQAYMNVAANAAACNALALEYHQAQSTQDWLTWALVLILALTAIPTRVWELVMGQDTHGL